MDLFEILVYHLSHHSTKKERDEIRLILDHYDEGEIHELRLKRIIDSAIKTNYVVLKAFDVADGVLSLKQYLEHMGKRKRKK